MIGQAHSPPLEIDVDRDIWALTFSVSDEYLINGGDDGEVGVWCKMVNK